MDSPHIVFVYGTLKRGGCNHGLLASAVFLGPATTRDPHPLFVENFPYLLDRPGHGHIVQGELYRVDNTTLAQLDILEDHPREYRRALRTFLHSDGREITAWAYFLHCTETLTRITAKNLHPVAAFDTAPS